MNYDSARNAYFKRMKEAGHAILPSASLLPLNDPTTLFTGSGMQPLLPYLLGAPHPAGTRVADSQKCFRAADIEEVGDNRHTTFFEMLGNWSFGDYFKKEQLRFFFEYLTNDIGLDPSKLYVTAFIGDETTGIPKDTDAEELWKILFAEMGIVANSKEVGSEENGYQVGMSDARIFFYDAKKNWWSRAGTPDKMPVGEPGGPDSEVFYDFGTPHDPKWGAHCHPNCDCGRFLEIGNSVFMEYIKTEHGFEKLKQANVDFGGGLERIVAAAHGSPDVFAVGPLRSVVSELERVSGALYTKSQHTAAFRVVADHVRGAIFMMADGVVPGNSEAGYFLRRLLRRSVRFADTLGCPPDTLMQLVAPVATAYVAQYPELMEHKNRIAHDIHEEEVKFRQTLTRGLSELTRMAQGAILSGEDAFILFSTYGFPIELTQEILKEEGKIVDMQAYSAAFTAHKNESRAGAEQRFKGGLADGTEATTRLHTTHHILLKALQIVLGSHVHQRGSNITSERLRIDFSHTEKMTEEQKREVERIVNEHIHMHLPMVASSLPKSVAETLNAEHEFGASYPDTVTVYSLGPVGATAEDPQFDKAFSIEFCGGPHVHNTSEIAQWGTFYIQKEEASSAGVRRIKGVLKKD
jgi:alanyl-tRNA synthetase